MLSAFMLPKVCLCFLHLQAHHLCVTGSQDHQVVVEHYPITVHNCSAYYIPRRSFAYFCNYSEPSDVGKRKKWSSIWYGYQINSVEMQRIDTLFFLPLLTPTHELFYKSDPASNFYESVNRLLGFSSALSFRLLFRVKSVLYRSYSIFFFSNSR